jgi:6-methylsalicylate decarboxylase
MIAIRVDVHQHLWTEPLLAALAERERLPFVRRNGPTAVLHCAGECAYAIDTEVENPSHRATQVRDAGLDLALIALSSPIGIEALARAEARALIDAYLEGVASLAPEFGAWGALPLDKPDPREVDDLLSRGCIGVSIPAGAFAGADAFERIEPVLAQTEDRGVPLFVHPGPGPRTPPSAASLTDPLWWPALTGYVAQMQAAWLTFVTLGRRRHPHLTVVFAMLAGGAPLLSERLAARGGPPIDLGDPLTFYESSSYGDAAISATAGLVGADQLVYGSDRPVVEPQLTRWDAILKRNAADLLRAAPTQTHAVAA